jgi:transcriptional regulator with XRE-family HTH domain
MTVTDQSTDTRTGGRTIRTGREAIGLSQRVLGALAGVSRDQIGRIERGEVRSLTAATHRVAYALGAAAARHTSAGASRR